MQNSTIFLDSSVPYRLTEYRPSDAEALVRWLDDREIYQRTLRIPLPYTAADARQWLAIVEQTTARNGQPVQWAIRDQADQLLGAIGFDGLEIGRSHRAELGYWLARPYWGGGIMTAAVGAVCRHAFDNLALWRITAHVFASNDASARVLEKNGFALEGYLRRHYQKLGRFLDAKAYGLLR